MEIVRNVNQYMVVSQNYPIGVNDGKAFEFRMLKFHFIYLNKKTIENSPN